ncbi:vacuolar iron transporter homolog 4-like protein [Tanacetum coccineum]
MASTATPPPPPPDHIVISVGITINVPTSAQQAPPTVVLSGPTTGQQQDASVQTQVDEAPPLSSPQPAQEIVRTRHEIEEVEDESEARPEAEPEAEPEPEVHGAPEAANVECFSNLKRSHWLRAAVLGAINGLLAPASMILDSSFPAASNTIFGKKKLALLFEHHYWSSDSGNGRVHLNKLTVRRTATKRPGRKRLPKPVGSCILLICGLPSRVAAFGIIVSLGLVVLGCLAAILGRTPLSWSIIRHVIGGWFIIAITVSSAITLVSLHAYDDDE